jgi:folate-binding protein YgfZ
LNAQGRVLSDAFVYSTLGSDWHKDVNADDEQGYLVEVDGEQASGLLKQFKKHKLRSKFKLRLLEDGELDTYSVWKQDERWTAHTKVEGEDGTLAITDSRAPGMGRRLLLPPTNAAKTLNNYGNVPEAPMSAYTIRRYLRGVPEGQTEIPADDSLPMNCNIDLMGGIDFKKGCYVGQELTIRTHHTGVVRRRILPIALYPHGQEPPEALEYDPSTAILTFEVGVDVKRDDARKRSTGKVVASIGNIGLAMCRLEQMSDLKVSGEGSSFSPGDKFMVQTVEGEQVGLKAFVPDWVRGQIREPKIQKRVG